MTLVQCGECLFKYASGKTTPSGMSHTERTTIGAGQYHGQAICCHDGQDATTLHGDRRVSSGND